MNENSGAARYYSPSNPDQEDQQAYLPDANGYVFTQTEYMPDNTGRIKRQSGVGATHTLGSGHETRYIYSTPTDDELVALFGNDVGSANHYKKTEVIDPNGQGILSYTDLAGKTIATGLSGAAPTNLEALSTVPSAAPLTVDMLNKVLPTDYDTDNDNNYVNSAGNGLSMMHSMSPSVNANLSALYMFHINSAYTEPSCAIDFQAVVDAKVLITSPDCLDTLYTASATFGTQGGTGGVSVQQLSMSATAVDKSKSYHFEKQLTVNPVALDYYADQYIQTATCLTPYSTFLADAWTHYDTTDCGSDTTASGYFDCDACVTALGTQANFYSQWWYCRTIPGAGR